MGLSWRKIAVIVGLSFSLGVAAAGHRVILEKLGQATSALSSFGEREQTPQGGSESSIPSDVSNRRSDIATEIPLLDLSSPESLFPSDHVLPQRGDLRVVVISDMNGPYRSTTYSQEVMNAVRAMPAWQPDLVISAGDMVGGQLLSLTPEENLSMWQGFDQQIFQPLRQADIPFAFTLGNHDGAADIKPEDATPVKPLSPVGDVSANISPGSYIFAQERSVARAFWKEEGRDLGIELVDARQFPFQYSFVHNDLFGLVWEASASDLSDDALEWAESQLQSPAAQRAKVRLSMGHLPLYAIAQGRDRPTEFLSQGDAVRDLLEAYDVQTHISGHHHAYYPGRVGELDLLYSGALGLGPRSLLGTDDDPIRTLTVMDIFFDPTQAPDVWTVEEEDDTDQSQNRSEVGRANVGLADGEEDAIATVYTTYNMATMDVIEPTDLPRVVASPTGLVLRQDMERRDLTYQDNLRYIRSW